MCLAEMGLEDRWRLDKYCLLELTCRPQLSNAADNGMLKHRVNHLVNVTLILPCLKYGFYEEFYLSRMHCPLMYAVYKTAGSWSLGFLHFLHVSIVSHR